MLCHYEQIIDLSSLTNYALTNYDCMVYLWCFKTIMIGFYLYFPIAILWFMPLEFVESIGTLFVDIQQSLTWVIKIPSLTTALDYLSAEGYK